MMRKNQLRSRRDPWNLEASPRGDYNILGMCFTGHGASLALVSKRFGLRALNLERFTGVKRSLMFSRQELNDIKQPQNPADAGVNYLLSVAYGRFPPAYIFEETFLPFLRALVHGLPLKPRDIDMVVTSECFFAVNQFRLGPELKRYFRNAEVFTHLEHHEIHQCQAYFSSPFDAAAVLTVDTCGEGLDRLGGQKIAITLSEAEGRHLRLLAEHPFPSSSPGRLYSAFSRYLGFLEGQEGKTMGLAPYGRDRIYRQLRDRLELRADGSFGFLTDDELFLELKKLAPPRPSRQAPVRRAHGDVAYAGQALVEDVLHHAVKVLAKRTASRNLCLAGGVALNSVANEKLLRGSRFERIYIMPNCGDPGQAMGCALYGERVLLRQRRRPIEHDYFGPIYSETDLKSALEATDLTPKRPESLAAEIARLVAEGRIVARFAGGSEYGPRALGNRSILADPRPKWMKDQLNRRVKHREAFRPFAPIVLEEKVSEWFDLDQASPYMLRVVPVRPEKRDLIPAITHCDGSARVQTVSIRHQAGLHQLLCEFENVTGIPVLLNTSFNIAGRPIVETPTDALECFRSTEIDALALGPFLLKKPEFRKRTTNEKLQEAFAGRFS